VSLEVAETTQLGMTLNGAGRLRFRHGRHREDQRRNSRNDLDHGGRPVLRAAQAVI
jgi:hypothetical protein